VRYVTASPAAFWLKPSRTRSSGEILDIEHEGRKNKLTAGLYCTDDIAAEIENRCEFRFRSMKLSLKMICAEQIIDPKTNRIIVRPDRPIMIMCSIVSRFRFPELKIRSRIIMRSPLTCDPRSGSASAAMVLTLPPVMSSISAKPLVLSPLSRSVSLELS
jgi:hypothetical protein